MFPRHGGLTNTTLWPDAPLAVHHAISEAAIAGYLRGFGRVGADFWPVLSGSRGKRTLINRYPASSRWERLQVGACTPAMLHPGPEGAVGTVRLEMLRQDLAGEDHAIRSYKERIAQAEELREYGLRRVLEDILIQEEEHKRDLLTVVEP